MRKFLIISVFFVGLTNAFGQTITANDSLKINTLLDELLQAIQSNNTETIRKISTKKIYCILCFKGPDFSESPYMLDIEIFLNNNLNNLKEQELFQRATKKKDLKIMKEANKWTDLTALITIYEPNELADGHEGGQLGIYFKLVGTEYKFSGLETIP